MTGKRPINPAELAAPIGFAHAWLVESNAGKTLYLAGQCAHDSAGVLQHRGDLVGQLDLAMSNIGVVLREAGMAFTDVVQMDFFVRDRDDYTTARKEFARIWRQHCGKHFPAMAMFMVSSLFDPEALIEIKGVAANP